MLRTAAGQLETTTCSCQGTPAASGPPAGGAGRGHNSAPAPPLPPSVVGPDGRGLRDMVGTGPARCLLALGRRNPDVRRCCCLWRLQAKVRGVRRSRLAARLLLEPCAFEREVVFWYGLSSCSFWWLLMAKLKILATEISEGREAKKRFSG